MDDVHVTNGVDITLLMNDLFIVEGSHDVIDSIYCLNMAEESVSKACTFRGSSDEPSDIGNGNGRTDLTLGLVHFHQLVKALVWHVCLGVIRVNCAEREVFSWDREVRQDVKGR
jgi:hypothetical protein